MTLFKAALSAALLALPATPLAAQTTIIFNNFLSPNDALWQGILQPWLRDIEAATQGRVTFATPESSLAPPPEILNAVRAGVADAGFQMVAFQRQSNPEMQLPLLPMTYFGNEETSVAFWRTHQQFFAPHHSIDGVELLGVVTTPANSLLNMQPTPFQSLADLSGVKMWALPGMAADTLGALGTVVTPGPAVRMYEVISGGVVDAFCCINYESLEVFNVAQYVGSATEVPGGLFAPGFAVFIQSDVWATISAEDQAIIRGLSGEALARRAAQGDPLDQAARQRFVDRGVPIAPASDAFVAELRTALAPVYDAWIASVEPLGIDGRAALDFYLAEQDRIRAGQ